MAWDIRADRPVYLQLVEHLQTAVVTGEYPPGSRIPPVRELAGQAGVNPNTIQKAYRELERQGYIYTAAGVGTFVADKKDITPDDEELKKARAAVGEAFSQLLFLGLDYDKAYSIVIEIMKERKKDL